MTKILMPMLLMLAGLAFPTALAAQAIPEFPPGTLALEMKLRAQVGPRTREWLRLEAHRQVVTNTINEYAARESVRTHQGLAGLSGREIEAVAYLLLVQAARSAQQDMQLIESGIARIETTRALFGGQGGGAATAPTTRLVHDGPTSRPPGLASPQALGKNEFERRLAASAGRDDDLADMARLETLRLRMAADRLGKLMALLSNVARKLTDAQARIVHSTP